MLVKQKKPHTNTGHKRLCPRAAKTGDIKCKRKQERQKRERGRLGRLGLCVCQTKKMQCWVQTLVFNMPSKA